MPLYPSTYPNPLQKREEEAMVASMLAMKESKSYLKETQEITEGFGSDLLQCA